MEPKNLHQGLGAAKGISWIRLACRRDVIMRSLRVSLVVGSILVLINYIDRIIIGTLVTADFVKIILTYLVPYCVTTYASVEAIREGR